MKTSYREMFDEVHASDRLKEEVMNMTKQERTQVVKRVSMSFIVAAALAVILAGTALAAVTGVPETLQEWFGQQWTEAGGGEMSKEQTAVIESLVQPVDVSSSANGVTVTLDSVTPEENSLWMLLKLEGIGQEEEILWDFGLTGGPMEKQEPSMSSIRQQPLGTTEEGAKMMLLIYHAPMGVNFLEGGDMTLEMVGRIYIDGNQSEGEVEFEQKGRWALAFTLEPVENLEVLTAKSAKVHAEEMQWKEGQDEPARIDRTITLKNIRVTATGISFEMNKEESMYRMKGPELQLKGGMKIMAFSGTTEEGKKQFSWEVPVDISKVEAVCFDNVVVPLEQPKK